MNFSVQWEERYLQNTHLSVWPWSDLVSLVRRHCDLGVSSNVLEFGCGAGANIPFFKSLGVEYYALEGSATMVARLRSCFPELAQTIVAGDLTLALPFQERFHLVVDRAALTHNGTRGVEDGLRLAWQALRFGGLFVGVDWFSTRHDEFVRGEPEDDGYTRDELR